MGKFNYGVIKLAINLSKSWAEKSYTKQSDGGVFSRGRDLHTGRRAWPATSILSRMNCVSDLLVGDFPPLRALFERARYRDRPSPPEEEIVWCPPTRPRGQHTRSLHGVIDTETGRVHQEHDPHGGDVCALCVACC